MAIVMKQSFLPSSGSSLVYFLYVVTRRFSVKNIRSHLAAFAGAPIDAHNS